MKKIICEEFDEREEILINENKGTVRIITYRNRRKVNEEKRKISEYMDFLEHCSKDSDIKNLVPYEDIISFINGEVVTCDFCFKKLKNTLYIKVIRTGVILCRKCFYTLSKLRKEMRKK